MDTTDISLLKASKPAPHASSSEFVDFKDQFSFQFTRLEAVLSSVDASVRVGVSNPPSGAVSTTPFISHPTPLTTLTGFPSTNPVMFPSSTGSVDPGLKYVGFATRLGLLHTPVSTPPLVSSPGPV